MKTMVVLLVLCTITFSDSICCDEGDSFAYWIEFPRCKMMKVGKLRPCGYYRRIKANGNIDLWYYWLHKISRKTAVAYVEQWERNGANGFTFEGNDTVHVDPAVNTDIWPNWDIP